MLIVLSVIIVFMGIQNGYPERIVIEKSEAINSLFFPKNTEAKD